MEDADAEVPGPADLAVGIIVLTVVVGTSLTAIMSEILGRQGRTMATGTAAEMVLVGTPGSGTETATTGTKTAATTVATTLQER